MPVNNFDKIIPLLKFDNPEEFYFLQIIQRKKDFEEGQQRLGRNNNNRLIKAYYIYNVPQLLDYQEEIIKLCTLFNARAGINLNRRNQRDVTLKCLEMIAIALRKQEYLGISKVYNSACGKESSTDKFWIVDVDKDDDLNYIKTAISQCQPFDKPKIVAEIPSKSGIHLITNRFDRQQFNQLCPTIEIHTNNPTGLYIP